jgi:hypothetical protein
MSLYNRIISRPRPLWANILISLLLILVWGVPALLFKQ